MRLEGKLSMNSQATLVVLIIAVICALGVSVHHTVVVQETFLERDLRDSKTTVLSEMILMHQYKDESVWRMGFSDLYTRDGRMKTADEIIAEAYEAARTETESKNDARDSFIQSTRRIAAYWDSLSQTNPEVFSLCQDWVRDTVSEEVANNWNYKAESP